MLQIKRLLCNINLFKSAAFCLIHSLHIKQKLTDSNTSGSIVTARALIQKPEDGLTIDEQLLLLGQDAGQVSAVQTTLPLSSVPRPAVGEVFIAVRLKLLPSKPTHLSVCSEERDGVKSLLYNLYRGCSTVIYPL